MRKMIIKFGYNAEFCGDAHDILQIASIVDDLIPVSSFYSSEDKDIVYYENNNSDVQVTVLKKNQEIKPFEYYQEWLKSINKESNE